MGEPSAHVPTDNSSVLFEPVEQALPLPSDTGPDGSSSGRELASLPAPLVALLSAILLALALGVGYLMGEGTPLYRYAVFGVVALGVVGATAILALTRFWVLVVGLILLRSSLDFFKASGYATGALDPGVLVGIMFLMASTLWLATERKAGRLVPFSRPTKWLGAFAAACFLSAAGSQVPAHSIQSSSKVLAGVLMFAVLEQAYHQRPERIYQILAAGAASTIAPLAVAVIQARGGGVEGDFIEVSRIRGTFVHPNSLAMYLILAVVASAALLPTVKTTATRAATIAVGLGATTCLIFTYARGAWIALILGLIVLGVRQTPAILIGLAVGVAVAVLAIPSIATRFSDLDDEAQTGRGNPNSLDWRINYWQELLPTTANHPVTGSGFDSTVVTNEAKLMPHNSVVQAIVEVGLLGIATLTGFAISLAGTMRRAFRRSNDAIERAVIVAAMGSSLAFGLLLLSENVLIQASLHWYLATTVAFATANRRPLLPRASDTEDIAVGTQLPVPVG